MPLCAVGFFFEGEGDPRRFLFVFTMPNGMVIFCFLGILRSGARNGSVSACGPSDFCDETKVTKNSFRGAAPEDPFLFREKSAFRSPYAAFRSARRRALRIGTAMLWTQQPFCRVGAAGEDYKPIAA